MPGLLLPVWRCCLGVQGGKKGGRGKKPDLNAIRQHRGDRKARRARAAEQDQAVQVGHCLQPVQSDNRLHVSS